MNLNKKRIYLFILIGILLFGTILRFMNTPDRYSFDGDGIRDAIVAYQGKQSFTLPLAGPFSSTGPYTFGPWYYIGLIIPMMIVPAPYTPWIIMGVLSLLTILIMADIGRLLYGKPLGIILALLTAIAPVYVNVANGLSNLNPVLFFAALSLWVAFKLTKKEFSHPLWYVGLGLALGFGINAHYQMLGLLLLPLLVWLWSGWKKYSIPFLIGVGLFITFIPLLIFNVLTHWHTINGFNEMLIAKERIYVPNSWKLYVFTFWVDHLKFIFFTPPLVTFALVATGAIIFCIHFFKKHLSPELIILTIIFFGNFIWLRFYWGERHDVYLYYLTPLLFIFLGYTIVSLIHIRYGKIVFVLFSLLLGWHMLAADYTRIVEANQTHPWKKEVDMLLEKYPYTNIIFYSCNSHDESHKRTLIYFLRFHYQPEATEKKIAINDPGCRYPMPFQELQGTTVNFIDLSPASESAIQDSGWKQITTETVFDDIINWWKK